MKRLIKKILMFIKKYTLRSVKIGKNVDFYKSIFEGKNSVGKNTIFTQSNIGFASYIGEDCKLSRCNIGRFTSIGNDVKIIYGRHPTNEFFSTHPSFYSTKRQVDLSYVSKNKYSENNLLNDRKSCHIGSDVWIGEGVRILEGVKIADGSIIGTGSLVTKDTKPYSISLGTPARLYKFRYDSDRIEVLMNSKWWDMPISMYDEKVGLKNIENVIGD